MLLLVAYSLTNSNTAVSGIVLSFAIPASLFGIIAGVFVDHWNKKKVLFITNLLRFFLLILLAFFYKNLFVIYAVSFIGAVITQFFIPAETPMIPVLIEKKLLISANALFSLAWFGSVFFAYALSGPFLLFLGTQNAFFALAVLYLIASLFILFIPYAKEKIVSQKIIRTDIHLWTEIKHAFHVIIKIREVTHAMSLLVLSQVLILVIAVLGPGYAKQILGININQFPIVFVTPAVIGMAVGAYVVAHYFHKYNRHKSATLGLFLASFSILLMPFGSKVASQSFVQLLNTFLPKTFDITILHFMVVLAFILGIANSFIFVPSNTLVQENTSEELRGKVYGTLNTLASLFSIIPVIMAGSLADVVGVGNVISATGIIIGVIALFRLMLK
jgi:MFS family permease